MWECPNYLKVDGQQFLIVCPQGIEADGFDLRVLINAGIFR